MTTKDLRAVLSALWDARPKWYNIGLELGLTVEDLDIIAETNLKDADKCLTEILAQWLRQANPLPTWSIVVKALRSQIVNLTQLASKIENESLDPATTPTYRNIREFQALNDKQKEQYEERLKLESQNIRLKFLTLCNKFFHPLGAQKLPVKELMDLLKEGLKVLNIVSSSKAENIDNVDSVKQLIREFSTFFDYCPVEYMINNVGMEEDRQLLKEYKRDFEQYIKFRAFECPTEFGPTHAPNSTELWVKVESDYHTLVELKQFQCQLVSILDIFVHVLRIRSIKEGCVQLIFLIPNFVQEAIFPLSAKQETALKELGIIQLSCGDYHFPKQVHSILIILFNSMLHVGENTAGFI